MGINNTCAGVAAANGIPYAAVLGSNPAINGDCSNLNPNGFVICLSPPSGTYNGTTIAGVSATATAPYATATVSPPGNTAFGTTTNCGLWYQVQTGDWCSIISVSKSIALDLLYAINPSIDSACDNLVPGLWYCVQPTYGWNTTAPSTATTTESAPGPTPSGTTPSCYVWHVIATNDTCSLIEDSYGISMGDLVNWNPSLDNNCGNLLLGGAYCVKGPHINISSTATSTSSGSTTSSASVTTTPTSSCTKTYTAVSGDYCDLIEQKNDITDAQLRAWNPQLDANCDVDIGDVLCVAQGISSSTTASAPSTATSFSVCLKTYTVVSGDYCFLIEQNNGITEAQLRAWNPSLDAACDLAIGQVLCVSQ